MSNKPLSDYAKYITEKISVLSLNPNNFIGVDNMLPNIGGIVPSDFLPTEGQAISFQKGDILLGNIRPYFKKLWLAEFNGGCSADVLVIRPNPGISSEYIYSILSTDHFFEYNMNGSTGSKMPRGDKNHIMRYPLQPVVNPENRGKLIVNIDSLRSRIRLSLNIIEEIIMLLYQYWFVQFDFPDKNGKPYKFSGGQMIWNEVLKRYIPAKWHDGTISDLGHVVGGATPSTQHSEYYVEKGIGWITPNDLSKSSNRYISHGERDITEEAMRSCSTVLLPEDSVLMSSRAPIGYLAIASEPVCTNQGLKSIVPENFGSEFIFQTLKSIMPYIKQFGVGSTFSEVSKEEIEGIKIIIPPSSLEEDFRAIVDPLCKQIKSLENENSHLLSLRNYILPILMNGQVELIN